MVEGQEKTKEFIIRNKLGLHLRPAGLLVKTANKYKSDITVEKDGVQVDERVDHSAERRWYRLMVKVSLQ